MFNEGLPSKDTQYDYAKDVEERAKQDAEDLKEISIAGVAPVQSGTAGDGEPVLQAKSAAAVQDTNTASTQPVQQTEADKKSVPQIPPPDKQPGTDDADEEKVTSIILHP